MFIKNFFFFFKFIHLTNVYDIYLYFCLVIYLLVKLKNARSNSCLRASFNIFFLTRHVSWSRIYKSTHSCFKKKNERKKKCFSHYYVTAIFIPPSLEPKVNGMHARSTLVFHYLFYFSFQFSIFLVFLMFCHFIPSVSLSCH